MSECLLFLDKHLISLVKLAVLAMVLFAMTGCGAVDALMEDVAGTATSLRKWTAPMAARARAKGAEEDAKWLALWQAEQVAYAKLGYDPIAFPIKDVEDE